MTRETLLRTKEAAEQMEVCVVTILRMIKRKDLKATQVGNKREYRVYQSSVDNYLEKHNVEQPDEVE